MTITPLLLLADSPDSAMELARLKAQVGEIDLLAQRAFKERGEVMTLAWLRRITHQIDRLQASWREALPPASPPATVTWRRRSNDADDALMPRE